MYVMNRRTILQPCLSWLHSASPRCSGEVISLRQRRPDLGVGFGGCRSCPRMTGAAFRNVAPSQIADATPQQNIMRAGGGRDGDPHHGAATPSAWLRDARGSQTRTR